VEDDVLDLICVGGNTHQTPKDKKKPWGGLRAAQGNGGRVFTASAADLAYVGVYGSMERSDHKEKRTKNRRENSQGQIG